MLDEFKSLIFWTLNNRVVEYPTRHRKTPGTFKVKQRFLNYPLIFKISTSLFCFWNFFWIFYKFVFQYPPVLSLCFLFVLLSLQSLYFVCFSLLNSSSWDVVSSESPLWCTLSLLVSVSFCSHCKLIFPVLCSWTHTPLGNSFMPYVGKMSFYGGSVSASTVSPFHQENKFYINISF